jgi:desulfoferrodoxin (superoxide reductase-like protein)
MIDNPNGESTPVYNTVDQAKSAFANLLNATDESQEQTTESVEATQDEPYEANESEVETGEVEEQSQSEDQTEDYSEEAQEEEAKYEIKVNGKPVEVTLDELMSGYQRDSDYRRKTMELADERRLLEEEVNRAKSESDAVAKLRQDYATRLSEIENSMKPDANIDWARLYETDPDEYHRKKIEVENKSKALETIKAERQRAIQEQQQEQSKVFNQYLEQQKKLLADKEPESVDPVKGEILRKDMTSYLKKEGYSDQELNMMVDHRSFVIAKKAMLYDKMMNSKISAKQSKTVPKMVRSGTTKTINKDSQQAKSLKSRLKQTGSMRDAANVLKQFL